MNYLNICDIDTIKKNGDLIEGVIRPKNYSSWQDVDAFGLFMEGIHQFCVRACRKNFESDSENVISGVIQNTRIVPVQINNLELHITPEYETYYMQGVVIHKSDELAIIDFKVYPNIKFIFLELCAQGQVYVSNIHL